MTKSNAVAPVVSVVSETVFCAHCGEELLPLLFRNEAGELEGENTIQICPAYHEIKPLCNAELPQNWLPLATACYHTRRPQGIALADFYYQKLLERKPTHLQALLGQALVRVWQAQLENNNQRLEQANYNLELMLQHSFNLAEAQKLLKQYQKELFQIIPLFVRAQQDLTMVTTYVEWTHLMNSLNVTAEIVSFSLDLLSYQLVAKQDHQLESCSLPLAEQFQQKQPLVVEQYYLTRMGNKICQQIERSWRTFRPTHFLDWVFYLLSWFLTRFTYQRYQGKFQRNEQQLKAFLVEQQALPSEAQCRQVLLEEIVT